MTGMEHAIEKAADVIANALHDTADVDMFGGYTDTDDLNDSVLDSRYSLIAVARALADAGLLAPAPLREEWATRFPNGHLRPGKGRGYDMWFKGDPPKGVNVRRWVSDWEEQ